MRRDLSPSELDHMEWALELDQRAARALVPAIVKQAREDGDLETICAHFGAMYAPDCSVVDTASGLVNVETSQELTDRRAARVPFRLKAEGAALRDRMSAFVVDHEAIRLKRLRLSVSYAARRHCLAEKRKASEQCLMVTLTYRGTNEDWDPKHITAFIDRARDWLRAQGQSCRYVWVAELQKRGVIHYHVALWVAHGTKLPFPDQPYTYGGARGQRIAPAMWPHGMSKIEVARAAVPYLLKYLSKDTSKCFGSFPKGARIYGRGGLDHATRRSLRWFRLPSFIQAQSSIDDKWERADGGGWTSPTGQHFESEFAREWMGEGYAIRRVHFHDRPEGFEPAGPFSWACTGRLWLQPCAGPDSLGGIQQ